jgi:hypothetical protein
MKIENMSEQKISSSGVEASNSFKIARTPHMFNILSSGLYSDKIAAVLREVGCNAMDSHVMAGKPNEPIEVKLPSELDPTFYIKDSGVGLDDAEARNLYATYGWSNKQENNDVTGAFGLGSKAPFAYTAQSELKKDGFTVIACKNGVQRNYVCYIDETGSPVITRIGVTEAPSDWQNGVMVKFSVLRKDIQEFHKKALSIFKWFNVPPVLLGGEVPPNPLKEKTTLKVQTSLGSFCYGLGPEDSSPGVVTGNVRYALDPKQVLNAFPAGAPKELLELLLYRLNYCLEVPTGSVLMTPSRENLQYTAGTLRFLQDFFMEVLNRIKENSQRGMEAASKMKAWPGLQAAQKVLASLPWQNVYAPKQLEILHKAGWIAPEVSALWRKSGVLEFRPVVKVPLDEKVVLSFLSANRETPFQIYVGGPNEGLVVSNKAEKEPLTIEVSKPLVIAYADSRQAAAEAKAYSKVNNSNILLVRTSLKQAALGKKIAEELASTGPLEGAEVLPTSKMVENENVKSQVQTIQSSSIAKFDPKKDDPKTYYQDYALNSREFAPGKVLSKRVTLKELQGMGCNMFVILDARGALSSKSGLAVGKWGAPSFFEGVNRLREMGAIDCPSVVVADSALEIRKVRLEEQGFTNLLDSVAEQLKRGPLPAVSALTNALKVKSVRVHGHYGTMWGDMELSPSFVGLANVLGFPKVEKKLLEEGAPTSFLEEVRSLFEMQVAENSSVSKLPQAALTLFHAWNNLAAALNLATPEVQLYSPSAPLSIPNAISRIREKNSKGAHEEWSTAISRNYLFKAMEACRSPEEKLDTLIAAMKAAMGLHQKMSKFRAEQSTLKAPDSLLSLAA